MIGDCYIELNNIDNAIKNYKNAISKPNEMTTPFVLLKLGLAYEMNKDIKKALDTYRILKKDYPSSMEAREIDKNISRLENL